MKKIIIIAVAFLINSSCLFAQEKAGKQDTTQHVAFYACPMHSDITSDKPGKCPKCGMDLNLSRKEQMKAEAVKLYTCPMHPDVTSDKSGKCPKCGMALTEKKQ